VAVTKVEFYLDGALQLTDTSSPYQWNWNTTTASNNSHTLLAKAYDAAGNSSTSSVSVTVSNTVATLSLTTKAYKTKGQQKVDLTWQGTVTDGYLNVYRNNALLGQTLNSLGTYTDSINQRGGGTYTYQVCGASTGICSNTSTASF
jgi:hypothetical protein